MFFKSDNKTHLSFVHDYFYYFSQKSFHLSHVIKTIFLGLFFYSSKLLVGWFVGFYGISTFVGYLMPNPFLCK